MIYKAKVIGQEVVPDLNIQAITEVPIEISKYDLIEAEKFYAEQAVEIYQALQNSLPGGTMHQLLIQHLQSTINLYAGTRKLLES